MKRPHKTQARGALLPTSDRYSSSCPAMSMSQFLARSRIGWRRWAKRFSLSSIVHTCVSRLVRHVTKPWISSISPRATAVLEHIATLPRRQSKRIDSAYLLSLDECTALWGESYIASKALHVETISSKWLQSRTAAHTSQPLFPVLCSFFSSLLLLKFSSSPKPFLPYCASTGISHVLARVHTTARADRNELSAKKRYAEAGWQLLYGDYAFPMASNSIVTNLVDHYPGPRKSTSHPFRQPLWSVPGPDATPCAWQPSQPVQTC